MTVSDLIRILREKILEDPRVASFDVVTPDDHDFEIPEYTYHATDVQVMPEFQEVLIQ